MESQTVDITQALLRSASVGAEVSLAERSRSTIYFKASEKTSTPLVALASRVVTSADFAVQEAILQCLLDCGLRDCTIRAEEDTPSIGQFSRRNGAATIFIDPIDGSLAYAMGCPGWREMATAAGFDTELLEHASARTDRRLYGMALGALVAGPEIISVCVLPDLGITYHASRGVAFRNGTRLNYVPTVRPLRVAIGRRLLDPNGMAASPFAAAGIDVRWFNGSSPGVLWYIFERECTGYAGLHCGFDIQLASVVAQAAGLLVSDGSGRDFVLRLNETAESLVLASSLEERDRICSGMRRYK